MYYFSVFFVPKKKEKTLLWGEEGCLSFRTNACYKFQLKACNGT